MLKSNKIKFNNNNLQENKKKIIDMVSSLFVLMLKTGNQIDPDEINILYSLLENLFSDDAISWEYQLRKINETDISLEEVIKFLNRNLITLDKIRIVISLIVIANSDNEYSVSEVTKILELAKKLNVESEGFLKIIEFIENPSEELPFIDNFKYFGHTQRSIFKDYILFGTHEKADIRFRNRKINDFEMLLMIIEEYVFIGTNTNSDIFLNGKLLSSNKLYLIPKNSVISVSNVNFTDKVLKKIYGTRKVKDVIKFKKRDYDYIITNEKNKFNIILNSGTVFKNGKPLPVNKEKEIFFDDSLQIKGYLAFSIIDVIERRAEIGVDSFHPNELYINAENDYFTLTQTETANTVVYIQLLESSYHVSYVKKGWTLFVNNQKVEDNTKVRLNSDILTINQKNFRISNYFDIIEVPFEIEQITVMDIKHFFKDFEVGLDGISFDAKKGELVGVMGMSGSGKSTLLKCLSADVIPTYGSTLINGENLYNNLGFYSQYIGYVPQHDLLFGYLTCFEHLYYRAKLRMPKISDELIVNKINNILLQTNLIHRKNTIVGFSDKSILSGGERKRLSIALELLFDPTVIICDEPTSGLSSSDSEQIIEILKNFTFQGKIAVISIHQPGPGIFDKFSKILVMDKGGKQVFFGEKDEIFDYFNGELSQVTFKEEQLQKKRKLRIPEYIFDIVEYPEYDEKGEKKYEQVSQHLMVKRKFDPEYWKNKYKRRKLFELMSLQTKRSKNLEITKASSIKKKLDFKSKLSQFLAFLTRNFKMKIRNKTNLFITFAEAPLLAFAISIILRVSENSVTYNYHENSNISVFLFVSVIIFIFLGLSNSIEDVYSEKKSVYREQLLNAKMSIYVLSKLINLSFFSLIQVFIYFSLSSLILRINGVFTISILYLFLSAAVGFSFGLMVSSFLRDSKSIINILPVLLIPQIILGGAIIQYDQMNPNIKFQTNREIPEIVQFIPSRWLFEGLFVGYAQFNSYDYWLKIIEKRQSNLLNDYRTGRINSNTYYQRLNEEVYIPRREVSEKFPPEKFTNRFISIAVDIMDGRFLNADKNIFLSAMRKLGNFRFRTFYFNIKVIIFYISILNVLTIIKLKYFLKESK